MLNSPDHQNRQQYLEPVVPQTDPFAAENFTAESVAATDVGDPTINSAFHRTKSLYGSPLIPTQHPLHAVNCEARRRLREVILLSTPMMRGWCTKQPSLKKFVKQTNLYLYLAQEVNTGFGLSETVWITGLCLIVRYRDSPESLVTPLQSGQSPKAHTSEAIEDQPQFPDQDIFGPDGILAKVFGDAFVIASPDATVIRKLLGQWR